jgi:hypothetical protein
VAHKIPEGALASHRRAVYLPGARLWKVYDHCAHAKVAK